MCLPKKIGESIDINNSNKKIRNNLENNIHLIKYEDINNDSMDVDSI